MNNCKNCGSKTTNKVFCSMRCRSEFGTVTYSCKYCGKDKTISRAKYQSHDTKFCSQECRYESKNVSTNCAECGCIIRRPKSLTHSDMNNYCSVECKSEYMKSDSSDLRNTKEYQDWREDIKKRDGYLCKDCDSDNNLTVHHIIAVSEDESKIMEDSNAVTLCIYCHADRHESKEQYAEAALLRSLA